MVNRMITEIMLIHVIELSPDNKSDLSFKSFIYYEEERVKNKEVFSIIIFPLQNKDKEGNTDTP